MRGFASTEGKKAFLFWVFDFHDIYRKSANLIGRTAADEPIPAFRRGAGEGDFMKKRVTVAAFVALMALGIASVVQALPGGYTGFDDVYYSDATFTTQVGERFMQCYSSMNGWGVRSDYKEGFEWDCETGQPIDTGCPYGFFICDEYTPPGNYQGCVCTTD